LKTFVESISFKVTEPRLSSWWNRDDYASCGPTVATGLTNRCSHSIRMEIRADFAQATSE
jgi:hypothetical protein